MLYYFRRYPLSLVIMAVIFYLSFFTPPKTDLEEIPNIDKLVHVCMYGGLSMRGCIELMQAYLTTNRSGDWLDFLANSTGVLLAVLFGYYVIRPFLWRKF